MKKVSLVVVVVLGSLLMLPSVVWSQCPNLNFGYGTLANWQCYFGSCSGRNYNVQPVAPMPGNVDVLNRQVLENSGQLYDDRCSKIPKIPDGKQFSCRIGNSGTGAQVDGIEYEMVVDSLNSLLLLSFAWVLENPAGHGQEDKPRFLMKIKDSAGRTMSEIPCADINFTAKEDIPGLACNTGTLLARNWITTGFSLGGLVGKKIKIYFEVWDCPPTAHFGYAYIAAECRPMQIDLQYCDGSTAARMIAPEGFDTYTWTRNTNPSWRAYTRQINIQQPMDGEIFTCELENELGCKSQVKTVIEKTSVTANFLFGVKGDFGADPNHVCLPCTNYQSWYDTCTRTATFVDLSQVHGGSKKKRITWEIPTRPPVVSNDSMFTHTFPDPDVPTTYLIKLTVIAENDCADTSSPIGHYITVYPSARIKIDGPSQICDGKTEYLVAKAIRSQFTEHKWSYRKNTGATGTHQNDSLLIDGPGTYYLQSYDTNGCWAYDTLVVTSLKPVITGLAIRDVDCWGNATGGFEHGAITGGTGIFIEATWTYWDNVNKVFIDTNVIGMVGTSVLFRNQVAGKYVFRGMDSENCPITDTIEIKQPDSLRLFPTSQMTKCLEDNGVITFEVTGGVSPYDVSIIGPEPDTKERNSSNKTNYAISNLPTGNYKAKVIDSNKCVTGDVPVVVLAYPYPTLIVDTIVTAKCEEYNGEIMLQAYYITETDTNPAPGPQIYEWAPDTNSLGNKIASSMIGMLKQGTYRLHFVDGFGCKIDTSFVVDSFPSPIISYDFLPEICKRQDGEIIITVKSASPDYIFYEWDNLSDTTAILTDLKAGTYYLRVTDSFCEATEIIIIPHIEGPKADFTSNTFNVPTNTIFTLTDNSVLPSKVPLKIWSWLMGDGNTQSGRIIRHSYEETGDYIVFMEVVDTNGCLDTISKIIHVYDELHVYIPNAFTPRNGDNLNDTWKPIVLEHAKDGYMLTVYDRWGQRVFHTTDPDASWDGTINGKPAQNNTVYSYRLIVRDFTGQEFEYIGHVTILR